MSSVAETLAQADAYRGSGQLQQAEQFYLKVLQADADHVDALYLLGTVCHGLGRPEEAVRNLQRAVQLNPDHADAHHRLGVILSQQGELDAGIASLQQAWRRKPGSAEVSQDLRNTLAARDNSHGTSLAEAGNLDEAEACYRRALEQRPTYVAAQGNLGNLLKARGQLNEAAGCYRRVLELKPETAEAHYNLGLISEEQGRLDEAVAGYCRTLQLRPDLAEVHNHLGTVLARQGKFEEAVVCFRRVLELKPDFGEAHNFLGAALSELGKFQEAGTCLQRALELTPDDAKLHNNLGAFLEKQERLDEAVACYERALELKPHFAEAHNGRALALLAMGRFAEGWPEYEWRRKCEGNEEPFLQQPRWTGAAVAGARILLRSEQGLGDTLQFIRYAELVKRRCATVIVQCQPQLARLLAGCAGVDIVVAAGAPLPEFDFHAALLSLPGVFETSLANIPARIPYLWPDAESVEQWKNGLGEGGALKIGIAWQGKKVHAKDRFRSIPLAQFAGITRMQAVQVYSLQMGAGREQLTDLEGQSPIIDLGDRLGDFHDTAAIVRNLDLVITCDSAPAHLAGSLGVPVWVALSVGPDWRWLVGRADSPWYPTARLFRQSRPGDWEGVFQSIESELIKLVKNRRPASAKQVD